MWRKWYRETVKQLDSVRKELNEFKQEVFEKEVVQGLQKEVEDYKRALEVSEAKRSVLYDCNSTLTQALNNITKK